MTQENIASKFEGKGGLILEHIFKFVTFLSKMNEINILKINLKILGQRGFFLFFAEGKSTLVKTEEEST